MVCNFRLSLNNTIPKCNINMFAKTQIFCRVCMWINSRTYLVDKISRYSVVLVAVLFVLATYLPTHTPHYHLSPTQPLSLSLFLSLIGFDDIMSQFICENSHINNVCMRVGI